MSFEEYTVQKIGIFCNNFVIVNNISEYNSSANTIQLKYFQCTSVLIDNELNTLFNFLNSRLIYNNKKITETHKETYKWIARAYTMVLC